MNKTKIILNNISHPNAKRMEFFLNALKDELKEVPFNWKEMKLSDRLSGACRFISTTSKLPLTITVFFCDSYADGNAIAKANLFPFSSTTKWSSNGDLMYLVETEDEDKLSEVLSLFAGEE